MNIRRMFLFSTVSLLAIMGMIFNHNFSSNEIGFYNEGTQVQAKFAHVQDLSDVEKGELEDRVEISITSITTTETSASVDLRFALSAEGQAEPNLAFYIGYGDSLTDPNERKASLIYNVKTIEGTTEQRCQAINRINKNAAYDGLGSIGQSSFTTNCDITLNPGEEILKDSFEVINIFASKRDENGKYSVVRDEQGNLIPLYAIATPTAASTVRSLEDFVDFEYVGTSVFSDYVSINVNVINKLTEDYYSNISASIRRIYNQNEDDIASGVSYIRTRVNLNSLTEYYVYYENEEEPVVFNSIESYFNVTNNGVLEILLNGVDAKRISNFEIKSFYVYADIFSSKTNGSVRSSSYGARFSSATVGMLDLVATNGEIIKPKVTSSYLVDLNLAMGLSTAGFVLLYEAISVFVFFYLKNKNKDDEFKRMIPKQYFKTNTMGLITLGTLLVTIEAIAFRLSLLKNTLPVYNPLDIIIVIGGIASIILVGYFIRYFAIQFKNLRDLKRNERLKINKNVMEDGTLIISSPSKGE